MKLRTKWQQSCFGLENILNSKHEIRNSKQIQIFQKQKIKPWLFGTFKHLPFGFVSDFEFFNTPFGFRLRRVRVFKIKNG